MKRFLAIAILSLMANAMFAQDAVFEHVKARRHKSSEDRVLVDKTGTLRFDDKARQLSFKDDAGDAIDVAYDDVRKAVFEVTTHMRGGAMAQVIGGLGGAALGAKHVNDYWFYLEYKDKDAKVQNFLMEVEKESSAAVIDKAMAIFGERAEVAEFREKSAEVQKTTLKDLQSKHDLKVNKQSHPMPELKPDKALVVVVCPPLAARYAGQGN